MDKIILYQISVPFDKLSHVSIEKRILNSKYFLMRFEKAIAGTNHE